jgi:hypothetical protein
MPSNAEIVNAPEKMMAKPEANGINGDVPVYDHIHFEIRRYALENENNLS